jgi:hypothetical protein
VDGCAVDDYSRGEVAVVEIGISFAEFDDHLTDLAAEDAARTCDELRDCCYMPGRFRS